VNRVQLENVELQVPKETLVNVAQPVQRAKKGTQEQPVQVAQLAKKVL
jgi:hypothetical protein